MMSEVDGFHDAEATNNGVHAENTPQSNGQAFATQQPLDSTTTGPLASVPQMLLGGGQSVSAKLIENFTNNWQYKTRG